jgi:hypothetical protein
MRLSRLFNGVVVGVCCDYGSDKLYAASCWQDLWRFLSNFSAQNLLINSHQVHHIRLLLILFIISQSVYQMIIQAHLDIIVALGIMLGWKNFISCWQDLWCFLSNF